MSDCILNSCIFQASKKERKIDNSLFTSAAAVVKFKECKWMKRNPFQPLIIEPGLCQFNNFMLWKLSNVQVCIEKSELMKLFPVPEVAFESLSASEFFLFWSELLGKINSRLFCNLLAFWIRGLWPQSSWCLFWKDLFPTFILSAASG